MTQANDLNPRDEARYRRCRAQSRQRLSRSAQDSPHADELELLMPMKTTIRILLHLKDVDSATTSQMYEAFVDVELKTVRTSVSNMSSWGWIDGEKISDASPTKRWKISEAGLAQLVKQGHLVRQEPSSSFGSFGSHIGRVPSVFHLGGKTA